MINNLFKKEYGRRRRAEEIQCKNCNKIFLAVIGRGTMFCSHKCSSMFVTKNSSVELECFNCKKKIKRTPSKLKNSKHGFHFCSRKCKEFSQSLNGNCDKIRPTHYGNGEGLDYRSIAMADTDNKCSICGENEYFKLCVHHIDGKRKNNKIENLELVCQNCHLTRHIIKKGDRWEVDFKELTPREIVREFDYKIKKNGPVAQLVEHRTCNANVESSILSCVHHFTERK